MVQEISFSESSWRMSKAVIKSENGASTITNNKPQSVTLQYKEKVMLDGDEGSFCRIDFAGTAENSGGFIKINNKEAIPINSTAQIELTKKDITEGFTLKIIIAAESAVTINNLSFEVRKAAFLLEEKCNHANDILVIVPDYPSYVNLYLCAFAHSRNREYKAAGLNIQVIAASFRDRHSYAYELDDIPVLHGQYGDLKKLLSRHQYRTIVTHFVDECLYQIFDGYVYPTEQIINICHGPEAVSRYLANSGRNYFTKPIEAPVVNPWLDLRDRYLKKYASKDNVEWVFVSDWLKEFSESEQGIVFKHSCVINNVINEELFPYNEKVADDRKKILIIRKFDNIIQHSIDQSVMAILELSRRPYFEDLTFEIYGDGNYYETLIAPLKQFKNVHLHRTFISNDKISAVHKNSGILLLPSRHDAHAVAMGEGASSGLVVVGSRVTSNPYFMNEKENHTLADPEDPKELAGIIERLYYNPDEFLSISKRMSEFTRRVCSKQNTVQKEIDLIREKKKIAEKSIFKVADERASTPILSIVVPAYNVEQYIDKCLISLLNHRNVGKTEIIVVNDGSSDETSKRARVYETLSNGIVRVVDQENGGHGATINTGVSEARGKYFRLIDGDDWVESENLAKQIDKLEHINSDLVLTKGCHEYTDSPTLHNLIDYDMLKEGREYRFDDLIYQGYGFETYGPMLPTSTYKTELLKKADLCISEHKPYVDMEFNAYSVRYVETVRYYDLDIYRYLVGREGQSISRDVWKKKYRVHESIIFNVLNRANEEFYEGNTQKLQYMRYCIIAQLVDTQIYMFDQVLAWDEIDGFLKRLSQYPEANKVALSYVKKKNGDSQKILDSYHKYSWKRDIPIIVGGKKKPNTSLNAKFRRAGKNILPYGVTKKVMDKNKARRRATSEKDQLLD